MVRVRRFETVFALALDVVGEECADGDPGTSELWLDVEFRVL